MKVYIFKNINLSVSYIASSFNKFLQKFYSKKVDEFDLDYFLIDEFNNFSIDKSNKDYIFANLIVVYDEEKDFAKYYNVIEYKYISNKSIFNLILNSFYTYSNYVRFNNLYVERSNHLPNGVLNFEYLPIERYESNQFENNELDFYFYDNYVEKNVYDYVSDNLNFDDINVVAIINIPISVSSVGNITNSAKYMFVASYSKIYNALFETDSDIHSHTHLNRIIDYASLFGGNLYQIKVGSNYLNIDVDNTGYIFPSNFNIKNNINGVESFKFKNLSNELSISNVEKISGNITRYNDKRIQFLIKDDNINQLSSLISNMTKKNINKDYFFGTDAINFKVSRKSKNNLYVEISRNSLEYTIYACEEENKVDISNSFKINFNTNAKEYDDREKINLTLKTIQNSLSAISSIANSKNAYEGGANFINGAINISKEFINQKDMQKIINGSGDAYSNYYHYNASTTSSLSHPRYPIILYTLTSAVDEVYRNIVNGCIIDSDVKLNKLSDIYRWYEIFNVDNYEFENLNKHFTYLKGYIKDAFGIPINNINEINDVLKSGANIELIR